MKTHRWAQGSSVLLAIAVLAGMVTDAPIVEAARRGDLDGVRAVLAASPEHVNDAVGDGMTALHWAAARGDEVMTRLLLDAGADVNAKTRIGAHTALHLASEHGRVAVMRRLLEAGSDANAVVSSSGASPLHFAAASGIPEAVAVLLDHGATIDAREIAASQTPLMFAAAADRADVVRLLLARGADPSLLSTVADARQRAIVDAIAGERRKAVLTAFAGAPAEEEEAAADDDNGGDAEVTAGLWSSTQVQVAIQMQREVQERMTTNSGDATSGYGRSEAADGYPTQVGFWGGMTALHHAAREGNVAAALAMLDGGADVNQVSGGDYSSPLLMAAINGHYDLMLQLLERGANPNLASDAGTTPLYAVINLQWAPRSRYPQQRANEFQQATYLDVMKALLDAGADPNARLSRHLWYLEFTFVRLGVDLKGTTPFWRAAYGTDVDAMRLLVEYGADPNISNDPEIRGRPTAYPIHAATGVGYVQGPAGNHHVHSPDGWIPAARYLIEELGLDVNLPDSQGNTMLHYGASRGDNDFIRYVVSVGGDVTMVNNARQTTADLANGPRIFTRPWPETVALLENLGSINNHNCVACGTGR